MDLISKCVLPPSAQQGPVVTAGVPAFPLRLDLNPLEGIWSSLKLDPLAGLAFTGPAHLLAVLKIGLKKTQCRPGLSNARTCAREALSVGALLHERRGEHS